MSTMYRAPSFFYTVCNSHAFDATMITMIGAAIAVCTIAPFVV